MAYTGIYYSKIAKKFRVTDAAEGELATVVQENLTGVRVVRAFGRERHELARFDEKNKKFSGLWISMGYTMGTYWGFGDLFTGCKSPALSFWGRWRQSTAPSLWGNFWPLSPTMPPSPGPSAAWAASFPR